MIAPLDMLRYWRASLADAQLASLPNKAARREINWSAIIEGRVPEDVAALLIADWRAAQGDTKSGRGGGEQTWAPVLIAPLTFLAQRRHGDAGQRGGGLYAPLIMPARVAESGRLSFDPAKNQPWISRDALEPSGAPEPPLGALADYDAYLSTNPAPNQPDWRSLIDFAKGMCRAVTGAAIEDVALDDYDRASPVVTVGVPPQSPARHLIALANALEASPALPAAFQTICAPGPMRPQLTGENRTAASALHYGQMAGDYPLADRQRDAVRHLIACRDGDALAVNGPPGSGKTTLLQSVVATMVVDAALSGGSPPVIVVASTNNQAVTNVIDSFGKVKPPPHRQNDPLTGRWLPGVRSFAVYLPSASKEVDEQKYHVARLPDYGKPLAGMPADMLNGDAVAKAHAAYLDAASQALGAPFTTASEVQAELERRLKDGAARLKAYVTQAHGLLKRRADRLGETASAAVEQAQAEMRAAEEIAAVHAGNAAALRAEAKTARESWRATHDQISRGLEELHPSGGLLAALIAWILGFLPSVRAQRWDRCRRSIHAAGIEDGPLASLTPPANLQLLRAHLDNRLAVKQRDVEDLEKAVITAMREHLAATAAPLTQARTRQAEAESWLAAETQWRKTAEELAAVAAATPFAADMTADRLVENPARVEALLDVTLRYDLFLLAVHYWEARWLAAALELTTARDGAIKALSGRSREATETRWRVMACLTPCFVSTLYMLPKHLQYYDRDGENKNPPLLDLVDLLIVDEAGQTAAEIGGLGVALGRKTLVVGDVHQIEPVWSVGPHIDEGNLKRYGLQTHADALDAAGARACNGSLMKLARHASAFAGADETDPEPGVFLTEHRRCQTPIIAISNDLAYNDRLIPCAPTLSDPILPPLGWANVRAPSGRRGSSRFNDGEAAAIAEWLSGRRAEIEAFYGNKPIHEVVGVVTPFSAQKSAVSAALARHGLNGPLTVGTVHALQGAEREIVIFSPVHTAEDGGRPFFDNGPNMINVAASRARHAFLVFGDMRVFDPAKAAAKTPSGVLAKHLFSRPDYELTDIVSRPDFAKAENDGFAIRLDSLDAHRAALRRAFESAQRRVLVVSPYLSNEAVVSDDVAAMVRSARRRKVDVTIAYDPTLNRHNGQLRLACAEAVEALTQADASVIEINRIHNKTLAVDDAWIVEGSFNWLSAVRDQSRPYMRAERSLRYHGPEVGRFIADAWREIGDGEAFQAC